MKQIIQFITFLLVLSTCLPTSSFAKEKEVKVFNLQRFSSLQESDVIGNIQFVCGKKI
ncbi:hypothetical protein [Sphingobacterium endophyticum]|uniref:hypothetical protein n=1 Tax=Sphingobacterium endophyticum TaxID=2546448 RepID=UPI0012E203D8|nr:hypothetical protein [Sphingobacterium endophyticum]